MSRHYDVVVLGRSIGATTAATVGPAGSPVLGLGRVAVMGNSFEREAQTTLKPGRELIDRSLVRKSSDPQPTRTPEGG